MDLAAPLGETNTCLLIFSKGTTVQNRITTHFKENRKVYLGVTVGVLGCGALMYVGHRADIMNKPMALAIGSQNIVSQTNINVAMTRPGPKAYVVQCVEDQRVWASLRQAANDLGVNPARISEQLAGKIDHVHGLTFCKLGEV